MFEEVVHNFGESDSDGDNFSEKCLFPFGGLMPNLNKKSVTVSNV